jgi:hypothetical protein
MPWRAGVAALARWLADERGFDLPAGRAAAMPARRAGALS